MTEFEKALSLVTKQLLDTQEQRDEAVALVRRITDLDDSMGRWVPMPPSLVDDARAFLAKVDK